jgi:hypothetical protein
VTLETGWIRKPKDMWCFEVTDVVLDGYAYDAQANVVTIQSATDRARKDRCRRLDSERDRQPSVLILGSFALYPDQSFTCGPAPTVSRGPVNPGPPAAT